MDLEQDAGRLLDHLDVLRNPTDLDLLVFFTRHPRTLLATDQIAAFLGYGAKEISSSLDCLLEAGFITRTPHSRQMARLYVLADTPSRRDWLSQITQLTTTRGGRLALIWEIRLRASKRPAAQGGPTDNVAPPPLQFPHARAGGDKPPPPSNVASSHAPGKARTRSKRETD